MITLRHTTLGRTPLDEWSARRRDLYLATRNTHKRQTSMPPAGFETTIPVSERPQTHVLERAATGIGLVSLYKKTVKNTPFHYVTYKCIHVPANFNHILQAIQIRSRSYNNVHSPRTGTSFALPHIIFPSHFVNKRTKYMLLPHKNNGFNHLHDD